VHRDVSPQNLFVTYRGEVKLLDFGIAKAAKRHTKTEAGQVKGKYGYMSPEQCYGKPLDRRSDIFSLGILLYELTTSRRLFKRDSELETLKAITEQPVVPPTQVVRDYPIALERICLKALQRRREDRYATAAEMRRELLAFIHASAEGALPEEALGALMQRLFADRMADKREMLRRARSGSEVDHIPSAEVDESVEIPVVLDEATAQPTKSAFSALPEAPPKRSAAKWASVGLLIAGAAGGAVALGGLRGQPRTELPPSDAEVATGPSSTPVASPSAASSAAVAEVAHEVVLHVVSTPPGAEIVVAGALKAVAPDEIRVPRGTEPIVIEARLPGFETRTESVVPDVDRPIAITLVPRPAPRGAPPRSAPKSRPTATATATPDPGYQKL
jgi:serine/threonine-protein kinase